jgi:hypothetical protein
MGHRTVVEVASVGGEDSGGWRRREDDGDGMR